MDKWKDVLFIIVSCILLVMALTMAKHYIPSVKINGFMLHPAVSLTEGLKEKERASSFF